MQYYIGGSLYVGFGWIFQQKVDVTSTWDLRKWTCADHHVVMGEDGGRFYNFFITFSDNNTVCTLMDLCNCNILMLIT